MNDDDTWLLWLQPLNLSDLKYPQNRTPRLLALPKCSKLQLA